MDYKVKFREWNGAYIYDVYEGDKVVRTFYYIRNPQKGELLFDVVEELPNAITIEVVDYE